ncbi:chromosome segregation protein SMC [Zoogloea oleivorans]|uniref:Chromosome segregation protein SMC n=2 Tax=Zoogloea TaxID=349 RepID=A0A6C2D8A2_9RHOO|nr:AAA family ATPase [Zoogloea oleivorans]TYC62161.1 chromosome segregation protein SMC [Zoogloea oleivorans]
MFHIKQLELVHWDYWRRFNLPLDAQIITIVGPNGSGKTTLLDALRTLFGLRCSGKRDFRRYVRRANRSFAWIRAVVANKPGSTGKRPFFPCLKDEVTLACRIRRAGGDWTRDYAIADGDIAIEALEANEEKSVEWVGYRDYQSRLAWGGLTPAIAKVLALEQGDTDKLCEYSPKALLELVFDVFGDKEVLDNYAAAREEQNNAEKELAALGLDLDRLRAQAETKRLEADRFLEWKQLDDEAKALASEIVPRLEVAELVRDIALARDDIGRSRAERQKSEDELAALKARTAQVEAEKTTADNERKAARSRELEADKAHLAAHDEVRDYDKLLAERSALRARLAREAGDGAVDLEAAYAKADARLLQLQRQEREAVARFEEKTAQLRATRDHRGSPGDPEVTRFRARLKEAGIGHRALSEIVEVTDPAWQGAVEAVLRPYRHVLLLEREQDRHAAWALGEQERFRHFLVPELETAPPATRGSLAEVIRFADDVPRWLPDLLNRIQRVDDADTARRLPKETEWITLDGYHRERRGARHLGKPAEFHFGELARAARLKQLDADMHSLDARLRALRPELDAAKEEADALRARLHGIEAAQLLAARADAFEQADSALPEARARLTAAIAARAEAKGDVEQIDQRLRGIDIEFDRRKREITGLVRRVSDLAEEAAPRRREQARRIQRLRQQRRGIPVDWCDAQQTALLAERYGDARGARSELERLRSRLTDGDWITDDTVLTLASRLKADLNLRERDYAERESYFATTRRLTSDARAAYIAKLRATVRQYGKNLRSLGDLANVDVDCPVPVLENDDRLLSSAGLEVRFDFDRKGAVGLNDGEASGGQQVMKSLILLIALLMDEARPGGFVFIDEPFAHLDIANIDRVGTFLRATRAQYLITTPVTHNANVFAPAQLTLVTRKKKPGDDWAPPIGLIQRAV